MRLSTCIITLVVILGIGSTIICIGCELKARQSAHNSRVMELTTN